MKCELKVPPDCTKTKLSRGGDSSGKEKRNTSISSHVSSSSIATISNGEHESVSLGSSTMDAAKASPSQSRALVLYAYEAHDSQELSIRQGETVTLLSSDDGSGWIMAQSHRGVSGLIPANYIQLIAQKPPSSPSTAAPLTNIENFALFTIETNHSFDEGSCFCTIIC
jgi:hypothetical protein